VRQQAKQRAGVQQADQVQLRRHAAAKRAPTPASRARPATPATAAAATVAKRAVARGPSATAWCPTAARRSQHVIS